ncbi:hypothetical protein CEXT_14991 [Caerostris extrusa]|uniref:Transposase n=1 Tax=Caerostris extrusa TaxID=172846 RepID=A0AAV4R8I4_CAEEX|nr:hypothetical protein CEXT_14991 [Caerostris extrusa]
MQTSVGTYRIYFPAKRNWCTAEVPFDCGSKKHACRCCHEILFECGTFGFILQHNRSGGIEADSDNFRQLEKANRLAGVISKPEEPLNTNYCYMIDRKSMSQLINCLGTFDPHIYFSFRTILFLFRNFQRIKELFTINRFLTDSMITLLWGSDFRC